jgi:hypothetical protein
MPWRPPHFLSTKEKSMPLELRPLEGQGHDVHHLAEVLVVGLRLAGLGDAAVEESLGNGSLVLLVELEFLLEAAHGGQVLVEAVLVVVRDILHETIDALPGEVDNAAGVAEAGGLAEKAVEGEAGNALAGERRGRGEPGNGVSVELGDALSGVNAGPLGLGGKLQGRQQGLVADVPGRGLVDRHAALDVAAHAALDAAADEEVRGAAIVPAGRAVASLLEVVVEIGQDEDLVTDRREGTQGPGELVVRALAFRRPLVGIDAVGLVDDPEADGVGGFRLLCAPEEGFEPGKSEGDTGDAPEGGAAVHVPGFLIRHG